jgi:DNA segregation ATPase FtsK/SpoIIIE, S-DNA-T family
VIAVDECQVWFEHPQHGGEFEEICTDLVKRGPAVGIVIMLATQRPDAKSIPTGISANAVLRLCLKVMGWRENDMVLGDGAHGRGVKATMFSLADKGICYFSGEGDAPRIVRGFYVDAPGAEKIALRARGLRAEAGTLSGYALGQDDGPQARSFARDVASVFVGAETRLWCATIAARLREGIPGVYADITPAAVASQLRALGVTVKNVREPGAGPNQDAERAAVEAAGAVGADV